MASKPTLKSLQTDVDRLNRQVCTLMAYTSHLEQIQQVGVEERFVEAAAKQLLREASESGVVDEVEQIRATASYLARGQSEHHARE